MSLIALPSNQMRVASFELQQSQDVSRTLAGVTQVTSYPDRSWLLAAEVVEQRTATLRAWSLAMIQLSDRSNWFAYGSPYYSGPNTGYAGATPLVKGAAQLGSSLACDGVTAGAAILLAGDFLSFDMTTSLGATNRQLVPVTANATADGSGNVTFALAYPIRLAPADNAVVNIATPTAFFMFAESKGGPADYRANRFSGFKIEAIERILP